MHDIFRVLQQPPETQAFPQEVCVVPSTREKGVLEAPEECQYLCLLRNRKWQSARLEVLRPYTWSDKKVTLYGWTDGPNVYDHFENNVHDDPEVVIGWWKLSPGQNPFAE